MHRKPFFFLAVWLLFFLGACATTPVVVTQTHEKDVIGEIIDNYHAKNQTISEEIKANKSNNFYAEEDQNGSKKILFIYSFISNVDPNTLRTYWWSPQIKTERILDYLEMRSKPFGENYAYRIVADCNGISAIIRQESPVTIPGDDLIPFNIDIGFENEAGPQIETLMIHPQIGLWEKSKH